MVTVGKLMTALGAGPDLVVSDIGAIVQEARAGPIGAGTIALGVESTACNLGTIPVHWYALPNADYPLIMGNVYRMRPVAGSTQVRYGRAASHPVCPGSG